MPIKDWDSLRDPKNLIPEPAWAYTTDAISEQDLLAEAVRQLSARLGSPLPATGPALPSMPATHSRNVAATDRLLRAAVPTVHAWCRKHDSPVPVTLADPTTVRPAVDLLDVSGALDFQVLQAEDILAWAHAVGAWPEAMLLTTDLPALKLTQADLQTELSKEEREKQKRQQQQRTVDVDGQPVDIGSGLDALKEMLRKSLDSTPKFLRAPARYTRLTTAPPARTREGGGTGRGSGVLKRASDLQLNAIGFAGEWLAYHWLAEHYPAQFTDACWVSTNRVPASLPGDLGDDGLGYDFVLPFKGGPVMFEVKATSQDGGEIRLGESEVLAAQANARNGRWRLLVVTNALKGDRQIRQLRNPFDPASRGHFTFAGQGLRLLYRPESSH